MRTAALIAVLLASVLGAAESARSRAQAPKLDVTAVNPLRVTGTGFRARERVRVVVAISSSTLKRETIVRADGRFAVVFRDARPVDRCSTFRVFARGDRGSRASLSSRGFAECPEPDYP